MCVQEAGKRRSLYGGLSHLETYVLCNLCIVYRRLVRGEASTVASPIWKPCRQEHYVTLLLLYISYFTVPFQRFVMGSDKRIYNPYRILSNLPSSLISATYTVLWKDGSCKENDARAELRDTVVQVLCVYCTVLYQFLVYIVQYGGSILGIKQKQFVCGRLCTDTPDLEDKNNFFIYCQKLTRETFRYNFISLHVTRQLHSCTVDKIFNSSQERKLLLNIIFPLALRKYIVILLSPQSSEIVP